ncbi:MAG: hypothetical protein IJZ20_07190, partial [Clostridia bacterium]|nr:hypothetical protein [Clostridia bacterium]
MNNEYSNVGKHLKTLAGAIAAIILFAGIIIGGFFYTANEDNIVFTTVIILFSGVCAYLSTIMLYAFGVLVESV